MTPATTITIFAATFALICIAAIVELRIVADADRRVGEGEDERADLSAVNKFSTEGKT